SKTCINNVTGYNDTTPRGGVAWGVKGDGKPSRKLSIGKYLEAASSGNGNYTAGNPGSRMPTGLGRSRSWNYANKNVTPERLPANNFDELASGVGNQYQHFNGFLMNVQSRVRSGLTLSGGFNTGRTVSDNCEIRAAIPELTVAGIVSAAGPGVNATNPWCHID